MGCAENREIRTPNLDRLAETGIRMENFFCVSPVCFPARASILSGRIPSQHGIHDWLSGGNSSKVEQREPIEYLKGMPGYTDLLAGNGYTGGLSGKWHMGDSEHPQKSFSYWPQLLSPAWQRPNFSTDISAWQTIAAQNYDNFARTLRQAVNIYHNYCPRWDSV